MRAIQVRLHEQMRACAREVSERREIERTRTSEECDYVGALGQLAWYKLRYGENAWWEHRLQGGPGEPDDTSSFGNIEIKTSKVKNLETAHLLMREDYAWKKSPFNVLVLFDDREPEGQESEAHICGWATAEEVLAGELRTGKSSKTGKPWGYYCHHVPRRELRKIITLPFEIVLLKKLISVKMNPLPG